MPEQNSRMQSINKRDAIIIQILVSVKQTNKILITDKDKNSISLQGGKSI